MSPTGPALTAYLGQKLSVGGCHLQVIVKDRDRGYHVIDEGFPGWSAPVVGQEDPDQQLGHRDGGHRRIVLVVDQLVQVRTPRSASTRKVVSNSSRLTGGAGARPGPGPRRGPCSKPCSSDGGGAAP
jgi:hypothetical protein